MKNKKSKIVVPALGLILLSTAASISGSVAWFTANRTGTVKAGEFAVVKTSDNLSISLGAGVGTSVTADSGNTHTLGTKTNYTLTDASFDHTNGALNVVTPNNARNAVLENTAISSLVAGDDDFATAEALVNRGTNVYSAFTWEMTFSVTFAPSATKKQGLFLNLNDENTYMHEIVNVASGGSTSGLYTDPACTQAAGATNDSGAAKDFYRISPDATGKAFRIAFVPTAITDSTNGSKAYAKVWADNETATSGEGQFIDGINEGAAITNESGTAYGTETVVYKYANSAWGYDQQSVGSNKVFMKNGDNTALPADSAENSSDSYYLTNNSNYLGVFNLNAGNTVSITFKCVAWYEGTHPAIIDEATDFEKITSSMSFGVADLLE